MSKTKLTSGEAVIWDAVKGAVADWLLMRALVFQWEDMGMKPVMMRFGDQLLPWDRAAFGKRIDSVAHDPMGDVLAGRTDALYHPSVCAHALGITTHGATSLWVQWGKVALGLLDAPGDAVDDPDVGKVRLPLEALAAVHAVAACAPFSRLISLRVAAFFVAAQYEVWDKADPVAVERARRFKAAVEGCLRVEVRYLTAPAKPSDPKPLAVAPPPSANGDLDREILEAEARLEALRRQRDTISEGRRAFLQAKVVAVDVDAAGALRSITLLPAGGDVARIYRTTEEGLLTRGATS